MTCSGLEGSNTSTNSVTCSDKQENRTGSVACRERAALLTVWHAVWHAVTTIKEGRTTDY